MEQKQTQEQGSDVKYGSIIKLICWQSYFIVSKQDSSATSQYAHHRLKASLIKTGQHKLKSYPSAEHKQTNKHLEKKIQKETNLRMFPQTTSGEKRLKNRFSAACFISQVTVQNQLKSKHVEISTSCDVWIPECEGRWKTSRQEWSFIALWGSHVPEATLTEDHGVHHREGCVCVCVCVCEREDSKTERCVCLRERGTERERFFIFIFFMFIFFISF